MKHVRFKIQGGPIASRRAAEPVLLRGYMATCDFPGGRTPATPLCFCLYVAYELQARLCSVQCLFCYRKKIRFGPVQSQGGVLFGKLSFAMRVGAIVQTHQSLGCSHEWHTNRHLSQHTVTMALTSLCKCADSPEPSLLAHKRYTRFSCCENVQTRQSHHC